MNLQTLSSYSARVFFVLAVSALTLVLFTAQARADFKGRDYVEFNSLVSSLAGQPKDGVVAVTILNAALNVRTPEVEAILPRLTVIARDQSGIWSDTLLEGQFDADGETQLDQVQALYRDTTLLGYKMTYSERAWTTDSNGQRQSEGRIQETSYVSANLTTWFRDEADLADFSAL